MESKPELSKGLRFVLIRVISWIAFLSNVRRSTKSHELHEKKPRAINRTLGFGDLPVQLEPKYRSTAKTPMDVDAYEGA